MTRDEAVDAIVAAFNQDDGFDLDEAVPVVRGVIDEILSDAPRILADEHELSVKRDLRLRLESAIRNAFNPEEDTLW